MSGSASTVSRRVSEFVGVALFAASLIWIVSLASYEPTDPVWFFSTGSHAVPLNFAAEGRRTMTRVRYGAVVCGAAVQKPSSGVFTGTKLVAVPLTKNSFST